MNVLIKNHEIILILISSMTGCSCKVAAQLSIWPTLSPHVSVGIHSCVTRFEQNRSSGAHPVPADSLTRWLKIGNIAKSFSSRNGIDTIFKNKFWDTEITWCDRYQSNLHQYLHNIMEIFGSHSSPCSGWIDYKNVFEIHLSLYFLWVKTL